MQSDVPPAYTSVISSDPGAQGKQWIVNATTGGRLKEVMDGSAVVLDGGPRWVLSTALGFVTGGLWWTGIYTFLFALGNYAIYVTTVSAPWRSRSDLAGLVAYMILAAALSMASVPGVSLVALASDSKGLLGGLLVELSLVLSLVVSVGILHGFFGPFIADKPGFSAYADSGRWILPALVWIAASKLREEATKAVETKLAGLWCCHPIAVHSTSLSTDSLWDDWSVQVGECARRVGGYNMLGFSALDLDALTASSPSTKALKEIRKLRNSLRKNGSTTEPWIRQSLAFMAGYDCRRRIGKPESDCAIFPLEDIRKVIEGVISGHHDEVDAYQTKIENSLEAAKYLVSTEGDDHRWFYTGALVADSDHRAGSGQTPGNYGSRVSVSLAFLAKGTDPLARLACYAEYEIAGSSVKSLCSAISFSTEALVSELANSAGVTIPKNVLGVRGLAYATGSAELLTYSPNEMVAASHLEEAIVISNDTFSTGQAEVTFNRLWGASANVEKRVDLNDMVPLAASAPEQAGASACLGWMCHVGFTLAVLTTYVIGSTSTGFVVLFLVSIPGRDEKVSGHMDDHFNMIYVSCALNYARCVHWWVSLSPRGQATLDKVNNSRVVVFLFVNILPVVACTVLNGLKWWVTFSPCILANLPGLLNTIWYGWESAFKYEWWSWHVLNRRYSGLRYLESVDLRKRVGRNVLLVNDYSNTMEVQKGLSFRGSPSDHMAGVRFMVIGSQTRTSGR